MTDEQLRVLEDWVEAIARDVQPCHRGDDWTYLDRMKAHDAVKQMFRTALGDTQ